MSQGKQAGPGLGLHVDRPANYGHDGDAGHDTFPKLLRHHASGRASFREVKSYRPRKRWPWDRGKELLAPETFSAHSFFPIPLRRFPQAVTPVMPPR